MPTLAASMLEALPPDFELLWLQGRLPGSPGRMSSLMLATHRVEACSPSRGASKARLFLPTLLSGRTPCVALPWRPSMDLREPCRGDEMLGRISSVWLRDTKDRGTSGASLEAWCWPVACWSNTAARRGTGSNSPGTVYLRGT